MADSERTRYAAAVLRVVLRLKQEPDADLAPLIDEVLAETGLDRTTFVGFLNRQAGTVEQLTVTQSQRESARKVQCRARALGLELDDTTSVRVGVGAHKKVRSPVS